MSLFNLPVIHKEKEVSHHPWEKTVKDLNSNKIKHAYNSVHNPPYPKKKEKEIASEKERVKFTVIGNRVTKEFIYCAKMVQGIHKYRSKIYDPPVVKGVTSVDWPAVLNNLKIEYGGLAYCLSSQVAVLRNDKFLGGEKELRELIESEFIYHLTINYHQESVNQFAGFVKASGRSFAYMHISIDSKHIGTFIFMLYIDIVPKTCENFLRLCKTRKGGYSGTPVHRIVKDGWIQCGGFGLKSVDMDCENFIVPHDRRGVLAMANDGRHVDCSTQFFVLLQPAPWMQNKYVAFGQLIDGDSTLKAIEEVSTWYESPRAEIIIHRAGILNLDCQDIMINPGAKAYIDGHIDDLVTIGEIFYEALMEQVFLEVEFRRIARMHQKGEEDVEEHKADGGDIKHRDDLRATQRFMRRKDEIDNQLRKLHGVHQDIKRASSTHSKALSEKSNKEFDVDVYEYETEAEEFIYPQSPAASVSEPSKEKKPFYIPLTDVPYPEEVSSEYDLKKFLKGDYCLESDLAPTDGSKKVVLTERKWSYSSDIFNFFGGDEDEDMQRDDLDSDEEEEIRQYLKDNADRVSFAGAVIKEVAKGVGMVNLFENHRKSELITDEVLRRFRVASMDMRGAQDKRVSISVPIWDKGTSTKIKRRQTGFVRPEDLAKIRKIAKQESNVEEESEPSSPRTDRKISISINMPEGAPDKRDKVKRRQTGFVRPQDLAKIRLFNKGTTDDEEEEDDEDFDSNNRQPDEDDTPDIKPETTKKYSFQKDDKKMKKAGDERGSKTASTNEADEENERSLDENLEVEQERPFDLSGTRSKTTSAVSIREPFGSKAIHDKVKRRQTGFVKPEELAHIREFVKDSNMTVPDIIDDGEEEEEKEPAQQLSGTRSKTTSSVSINISADAKEVHERIKRRQTGFVKPEELAQIREFVKDQDIDTGYDVGENEKEKKTQVKLPQDIEEKYNKVKRRPTSFVSPGALTKIRETQGDDGEEEIEEEVEWCQESKLEEYGDDDELEPIPELSGSKKTGVILPEDAEEKYNKVKRRQTSFVKPCTLAKIRELQGHGEEEIEEADIKKDQISKQNENDAEKEPVSELSARKSNTTSSVSINMPFSSKEENERIKIKRRQTGFVKPEELAKIREFVKDEDIATGYELEKNENEKQSAVKLLIDAEEKYNKVKRRPTSFVKPDELAKIRELQGDDEEEIEEEEVNKDHNSKGDEHEEEDEKEPILELSGVKSKTTSAVTIHIPFASKEKHDKIHRRQTGFVKQEELAKIREFVKDQEIDIGIDFEERGNQAEVNLSNDTEEQNDKVQSRQTSFVKPEELTKIREFSRHEIEEECGEKDLGKTRNEGASTVSISEPEDAKTNHDQIKRRQTGFVSKEQLTKIREFVKDESDSDDNDDHDISKSRKAGPSAVMISEPDGAKTAHEKIKRRQTGFVSPDQLTKIREFAKDLNVTEEEDEKSVVIHEPEGVKEVHDKIKRRQTGFVKPQEVAKLRAQVGDHDDEEDMFAEQDEHERAKDAGKIRQTSFAEANELRKVHEFSNDQIDEEVDLSTTRSQGPSVVSVSEPEGAKEVHDKIKRRQTGFVSPDQLTKIREFVKDKIDEEEEDENKAGHKGAIAISEPEGAKTTHEKIKRRQTGFVKAEDAAKLRAKVVGEEDEDEAKDNFKDNSKDRHGVVEIREPGGSKEKSEKIKRRQTGFFKPQDLIIDADEESDECDKENNPDTKNRKGSISIITPENANEQSQTKRRQTGFVRPQDVARLLKLDDDEDDEVDDDGDDDGDARNSSDKNDKNSESRAEHSEVTVLFCSVTFEGRNQRECQEHRKVRIAPTRSSGGSSSPSKKILLPPEPVESDTEMRKSVLARLYDEVKKDDDVLPTLKDYRPMSESQQQKNILLKFSQNQLSAEPDHHNDKYFRPSITVEESYDQLLNLQHGKKVTRKISSDYVNTIDQIERRPEHSIRSVEYAKTRPAMTVAEYQKKNRLYQEERKLSNDIPLLHRGIRLPGDTPLYAQSPIASSHHLTKK